MKAGSKLINQLQFQGKKQKHACVTQQEIIIEESNVIHGWIYGLGGKAAKLY